MPGIPGLSPEAAIVFLGSIGLYGTCAWVGYAKNFRRPILTAFLVSAVVAVSVAVSLGWQGDSWSLWSAFVKIALVFMACTIPSATAALTTQLVSAGRVVTRIALGALFGAVTGAFMPMMVIGLMCKTLGDCL
jgi:hypothetical protein